MTASPSPYDELQAAGGGRRAKKGSRFSPEILKARAGEQSRRATEARRRALTVLAARHPDEYAELYRLEREAVNAKRGPMPGEEA